MYLYIITHKASTFPNPGVKTTYMVLWVIIFLPLAYLYVLVSMEDSEIDKLILQQKQPFYNYNSNLNNISKLALHNFKTPYQNSPVINLKPIPLVYTVVVTT